MRGLKLHLLIIVLIITYAVVTYFRIDEEKQFAVLSWFPVFIVAGIYTGTVFVKYALPHMVNVATNSILGSNAEIEYDPLHDARAALARGDHQEALEIYQEASVKNPENQQTWLSQVMIQQKHLDKPAAAIQTLKEAMKSHEWPDDERAFFMSRIADIQFNDLADNQAATITLQEIIQDFPKTRHSANATHKLHDIA